MSKFITLDQAKKMVDLYRTNRNLILEESERNKDLLPICETVDAKLVSSVLDQSGCTELRIYYGMSEDKNIHAILVGVDAAGKDILPDSLTENDSNIIEDSKRCPIFCPPPSELFP